VARLETLASENLMARIRLETIGFYGLMTANNNPLDSQKNPSEVIGFAETLETEICRNPMAENQNLSDLQSESCRRWAEGGRICI
jgi:hypothetical protein